MREREYFVCSIYGLPLNLLQHKNVVDAKELDRDFEVQKVVILFCWQCVWLSFWNLGHAKHQYVII